MKKKLFFTIIILLFIATYNTHLFSATYKQEYRRYLQALSLYKKLKTRRIKNKRQYSSKVIDRMYYLYKTSDFKDIKRKSLFMIGNTYYYLCKYYGSEIFADLAIGSFYRFVKEFPKSSYCDDANYYSARIYYYYKNIPSLAVDQLLENIKKYRKGDFYYRSKKFLKYIYSRNRYLKKKHQIKQVKRKKYIQKFKVHLKRIRTFGLRKFGRIVLDLSKLPQFSVKQKGSTIFLKLLKTGKDRSFKIISLNRNQIKKRISIFYEQNNLIVKIKAKYLASLNYFTLRNPNRIVVDFEINRKKAGRKFIKPHDTITTIIIDPGHGGHDPGATYYGLQEKDVTLKIGKYLRYYLERYLKNRDYTILMTRDDDTFLSLEDRAKFANENNADLFISIHCNANRNRRLHGFETYYLNYSKNQRYLKKMSYSNDVYYILEDLIRSAKYKESIEFAQIVENSIIRTLRRHYRHINDFGIKDAPFYVLMGTRMPAILVENSFISNKMENHRLRNNKYLKLIGKAIAKGVVNYINSQSFVK